VTTTGDPFEVSICHCLACQRRTGSAFGVQAGFTADQVEVAGRSSEYSRISDESDRKEHVFHFCPECGSTVFFTEPDEPELVAVMGGAFADQTFPAPTVSGYSLRRQPWVVLPASVVRHDEAWGPLQALYDAGEYAEVAERARPLIAADSRDAELLYNVACAESLAGRKADAIEHLGMAIECLDEFREMASEDSDLDALRDDPAFTQLMAE
jgi:hypothetical protein